MRLKMEYSDYDRHFWNAMRGKLESYDHMNMGRNTATGNYVMAPVSDDKFTKARAKESRLIRCMCVYFVTAQALPHFTAWSKSAS